MAKHSKNNNNNGLPKKSSLTKSSSDQKENRPKKVNKPKPKDEIPMSKQLLMKKIANQNHSRAKRQSKGKTRVCANGKIMPSFAELEKMFGDSDDDSVENTENKTNNNIELPSTPQKQIPAVINIDFLFSPTTRTRITDQVKEIVSNINISNLLQDNITDQPPKKRLKFESHGTELDALPPLTTTANTDSATFTDCIMPVNNNDQLETYQNNTNNNNSVMEPAETETKLENGNISDNSGDSNKTIEYKLSPSIFQSESVSQIFSPLPSTSKDNKTFIKNDELFSKSLRVSSLTNDKSAEKNIESTKIPTQTTLKDAEIEGAQPENISRDKIKNDKLHNKTLVETSVINDKLPGNEENELQIIETPMETILIDDELINEPRQNNKNTMFIETIHIPDIKDESNQTSNCEYEIDDDCIFVKAQIDKSKQKSSTITTDIIDLENEFIEPIITIDDNGTNIMEDEIIDVDELIAQNQTILDQYNKTEPNNICNTNVVDVDMSTMTENLTTNESLDTNQHIPDIMATDSSNTIVEQTSPNDLIIHISETAASSSSMLRKVQSHSEDTTEEEAYKVAKRFPTICNVRHLPDIEVSNNNHSQETTDTQHMFTSHVQNLFSHNYRLPQESHRDSTSSSLDVPAPNEIPSSLQMPQQRPSEFCRSFYRHTNSSSPSARNSLYMQPISPFRTQNTLQRNGNGRSTISFPVLLEQAKNSYAPKKKSATPEECNNNIVTPLQTGQEKSTGNLGDCPICMDTLSGNVIASTICGHVFCMKCLTQAIASNKRCPTCRKILKKNGYHQIFL